MNEQIIKIEADSLAEAESKINQTDYIILEKSILCSGSAGTIEEIASTIEEALIKAESRIPAEAKVEAEEIRFSPKRSSLKAEGYSEEEARKEVALNRAELIESISLHKKGRRGFLIQPTKGRWLCLERGGTASRFPGVTLNVWVKKAWTKRRLPLSRSAWRDSEPEGNSSVTESEDPINFTVRAESAEDISSVRRVNELAFGRGEEADLVDRLRAAARPYISLVAARGERVVGHIFFSPVTMEGNQSRSVMMGLAPMAVLPDYQKQGIGSLLVREGLKRCQTIGCHAVVVVGHPEYYPQFGFVPAIRKGLRCEYPVPDEAFMVTELKPGALPVGGLVKYRPEFGAV